MSTATGDYYPVDEVGVKLDGRYILVKSIDVLFSKPRQLESIGDEGDDYWDLLLPPNTSLHWEACVTTNESLFDWGCARMFKRIEAEFFIEGIGITIENCRITNVSQNFSKDQPVVSTIELWWDAPMIMETEHC